MIRISIANIDILKHYAKNVYQLLIDNIPIHQQFQFQQFQSPTQLINSTPTQFTISNGILDYKLNPQTKLTNSPYKLNPEIQLTKSTLKPNLKTQFNQLTQLTNSKSTYQLESPIQLSSVTLKLNLKTQFTNST